MVECQLPKLDVAGSSPVSRSIKYIQVSGLRDKLLTFLFGRLTNCAQIVPTLPMVSLYKHEKIWWAKYYRVTRLISFTISFAMNRSSFRLPTATIPNPNRLRQPADLYLC